MTTSEDPSVLIASSKELPVQASSAEEGLNANVILSDLLSAGPEIVMEDNQDDGVPADLMIASNRLSTSSSSATLQGKAAQDRINILREEIGKISCLLIFSLNRYTRYCFLDVSPPPIYV